MASERTPHRGIRHERVYQTSKSGKTDRHSKNRHPQLNKDNESAAQLGASIAASDIATFAAMRIDDRSVAVDIEGWSLVSSGGDSLGSTSTAGNPWHPHAAQGVQGGLQLTTSNIQLLNQINNQCTATERLSGPQDPAPRASLKMRKPCATRRSNDSDEPLGPYVPVAAGSYDSYFFGVGAWVKDERPREM